MKPLIRNFCLLLITGIVLFASDAFSQGIYSSSSNNSLLTEYGDNSGAWPPNQQDSVFIFCSDNPNAGELCAPFTGCNYQWYEYNSGTFAPIAGATNQCISNLASGGYRVVTACSGDTSCYNAWVFVNQTVVDAYIENDAGQNVGNQLVSCDPFCINGSSDPVSDFTVYNPPATDFVVSASTTIEVCFSGDHTWVSDLGFYLVAPGYGPGTGNPSVPGNYGTVELLPSVAAWDNGVTALNSNILGCSLPSEIGTNCNNGDDINQLCFSTNNSAIPCICDEPTPLTGWWGSAGPWSQIYGFSAGLGGWSVQIYDCIGADVGHLTEAMIRFSDLGQCGNSVIEYNSGPISSAINDNTCDDATASIYTVPLAQPYSYVINNNIVNEYWEVNGTLFNSAQSVCFEDNNPTAEDMPSSTTTYTYVAVDNLGCEKSVDLTYVTLPTDATITNTNTTLCISDSPELLTAVDGGGIWSGNGVTNGYFYPNDPDVLIGGACNWVIYSIGGPCPDIDSICFVVNEPPTIYNIQQDSCIVGSTPPQYISQFSIVGGTAPYTVIDSVSGLSAGTVAFVNGEYVFTSNPLVHSQPYTLIVDNNDGCGVATFYSYFECGCVTWAGSMGTTPVTVCEGESIDFIHNADSNTLAYDLFEYIIHDGTLHFAAGGTPYFEPLGYSDDLTFNENEFLSGGPVYGQTYYISAIAGQADSLGSPIQWHVDEEKPCYNQAMVGTPVMWMEAPSAIITATTAEVCGKTISLSATAPQVGLGSWSCPSCIDFIPVNGTNYNDANVTVTVTDFGPRYLYWTVNNGMCSARDSILVNFKQTPTAYAGPDKRVCGLVTHTEGALSTGNAVEWSGPGIFGLYTDLDSTVRVQNYGTYTFTIVESNGTCEDEDYVNIVFVPEPAPIAGGNDTVCGTNYTLNCTQNLPDSIRFGYWDDLPNSVGVAVNFTDIYSPSTDIFVSGSFGDSTTLGFVWYERNDASVDPVCESTDTVWITFVNMPYANAGPDQTICGNTVHLDATLPGNGLFQGTWSVELVNAVFDSSTVDLDSIGMNPADSANLDPDAYMTLISQGSFGDSGLVVVPVYWIVSNLNCKVIDQVDITFYQQPQAQAGLDETVCGFSYEFKSQRSIGEASDALWTVGAGSVTQNGISYSPNPPSDTNTIVYVPMAGTYYFYWTERNVYNPGGCYSRDTVMITFLEAPNVDAGEDFNVCGDTTSLHANPSVGAVGSWVTTPGVTFTNQGTPNAHVEFHPSAASQGVLFVWNEDNGICNDYDTVLVTFYNDYNAVHEMQGIQIDFPDGIIPVCGPQYNQLDANYYTGINGYWIDTVPGTQTFFDVVHTNTDTIVIPETQYGLHKLYWVLENGIDFDGQPVCRDSSDALYLHFYERPQSYAGEDFTACGLSTKLNADTTQGLYGVWSSNLSISDVSFHYNGIVNPNRGVDSVTVDAYSYNMQGQNNVWVSTGPNSGYWTTVTADSWEFYWQEDSGWDIVNFECSDVDTVRVIFSRRPTAQFYHYRPPCIGDTARIWANLSDPAIVNPDSALFEWTWGDGVNETYYASGNVTGHGTHAVSWFPEYDGTPSDTYLTYGDSVMHVVTLMVTNQYGCRSFEFIDTILEPKPASPVIAIEDATCSDANGTITLDTDANTYSFTWLDGRIPDPSDLFVEDLEGGENGYYDLVVSYKAEDQFTYPNWICYDSVTLYVPDTGEVTAFFDTLMFTIDDMTGLANYDSIVGNTISFIDRSSEAARSWNWTFFDQYGSQINVYDEEGEEVEQLLDQNPIMSFMTPGLYSVRLVVTSREGCEDLFEYMYIYIIATSDIEAPNVFTPNGDGVNDYFIPKLNSIQSLDGIIVNRWGKTIYKWDWEFGAPEIEAGWDGTNMGGSDVAPGVYFYIINAVGMDGKDQEVLKGYVHLVRSSN